MLGELGARKAPISEPWGAAGAWTDLVRQGDRAAAAEAPGEAFLDPEKQQKIQSGLSFRFFVQQSTRIPKCRKRSPPQRRLSPKDRARVSPASLGCQRLLPDPRLNRLLALTLIFGESLDKVIGQTVRSAGRRR